MTRQQQKHSTSTYTVQYGGMQNRGSLNRLGFIKYWMIVSGGDKAIENLVQVGYSREEARKMVKETKNKWERSKWIRAYIKQGVRRERAEELVEQWKEWDPK